MLSPVFITIMDESLDESQVVVREDIKKVVGGRTYYLAERHTEKGVFGFWVGEDWKNKFRVSK